MSPSMSPPSAAAPPARPSARPSPAAWLAFVLLALGTLVADQASKLAAVAHLTDAMRMPGGAAAQGSAALERFWHVQHPARLPGIEVAAGWFDLHYIENPGAAWGFLASSTSPWRAPFFLLVSMSAVALMVRAFSRTTSGQRVQRVALALVLGGAVGNLVDRTRLGYVIDFIDWHIGERFYWPTFNIADAGITVGVILLVLDTLRAPDTGEAGLGGVPS
jgi:signal peptidase II